MAEHPEPNTDSSTDATAATPPPAWRLQALQVVAGILVVAAIILLLRGLLTPASPGSATTGQKTLGASATATAAPAAPLVGHYAPDVTVRDMHDRLTPLSSLRGKVVLLNFWYVACPPCQIEMPGLERAYLAHQGEGFTVVGLDMTDDTVTISKFTTQLGITYPILRDIGERAVLTYQVRATPTSFLIDRDGVIRAVYTGLVTPSMLDAQLATLLPAK